MAIIAGAGNPVGGSNPAGVGENINFIGEHTYAYSGQIAHGADEVDLLDFDTPDTAYIIAWFAFDNATSSNDDVSYTVRFNEQRVMEFQSAGRLDDKSPQSGRQLLIPPGTRVRCSADRIGGSDTQFSDCTITGRVYA